MKLVRLGTVWCGGLAVLLVPSPWSAVYGALAVVGAVTWATAPRSG